MRLPGRAVTVRTFGRYGAARFFALSLSGVRRIRRLRAGSYIATGYQGLPVASIDQDGAVWRVFVFPRTPLT